MEKQLMPQLRFPEFDGVWHSVKLSNISNKVGYGIGSSAVQFDGVNQYLRITDIDESSNQFSPKPLTSPEGKIDEKYYLKKGDIVFARTGASVGKSYIYDEKDGVIVFAGFLIKFSIIKAVPKFIFYSTLTSKYWQWVQVMSMRSGQPGLNAEELKSFKINTPTLQEQQKIASFLTDVDAKITKLTKKKELLEQYKKGIMQKIFNQELRFKDDEGKEFPKWEEKQLKNVATFRRGSFPQPYGLPKWYDNDNGIPFVQVYDVDDNMLLKPTTKNKISALGAEQSVFVEKGSLVLTIQGSIGRIAKTQYDAYVDRTLLIFKSFKKPINIDYFKYVLFLLFEIEKRKAPGGIIKTITKEVLSSFNVMLPSIEEQTKIANFLSDIDAKNEALNTKIEQSKAFKKGLLQQMFV